MRPVDPDGDRELGVENRSDVPTRAFVEVLLPTRTLGSLGRLLSRWYAGRVERRLNYATVLAVRRPGRSLGRGGRRMTASQTIAP
jgi:hypothetical protein